MNERERIKVMIVDDHAMFVESLVSSLGAEDDIDIVATATTANEGLEKLQNQPPNVILLDHVLPDADGIDVAIKMLDIRPEARIVMLTQLIDEVTAERAIHAGCSGYVTKDKPLTELIGAIRTAAQGEPAVSPQVLLKIFERMRGLGGGDVNKLSPRETEILQLLTNGLTTADMSKSLSLSLSTVRNHTQSLLQKLGAHSQLEAVVIGLREGLVSPPRKTPG